MPNAGERPGENTWVIRLEGSWNDYYRSVITPELTLEEATGDVIAHVHYQDLHASQQWLCSIPVMLSAINEMTWEAETYETTFYPMLSGNYEPVPLQLIHSSVDGLFIQGSLLTTDRYHYIGIMLAPVSPLCPSAT